jgi:dihydropteroate synthase
MERDRMMIDPGFGFGKSVENNYTLLKHLPALQQLDLPILVGISRKSMIGAVTGRPVDQRLAGSIAATTLALQAGAHIVRTHDVEATVDAIRVFNACAEA